PDRPIGEALLDQQNLAGIGNVYKAEVLFLRGLSPWQPAGQVADLGALAGLARRLLEANKERFGHITTGSMRRGEEHWVYGRRGKPRRRGGTLGSRPSPQRRAAGAGRRSVRPDRTTGSPSGARPANPAEPPTAGPGDA